MVSFHFDTEVLLKYCDYAQPYVYNSLRDIVFNPFIICELVQLAFTMLYSDVGLVKLSHSA